MISKVGIIGLGALGILFASQFQEKTSKSQFTFWQMKNGFRDTARRESTAMDGSVIFSMRPPPMPPRWIC